MIPETARHGFCFSAFPAARVARRVLSAVFIAVFLCPAVARSAGSISGTVTGIAGAGVAGVRVDVRRADSPQAVVAEALTGAGGAYQVSGLPDGTYRVLFDGRSAGYFESWYPDRPAHQVAGDVNVAAGAAVSGIDIALETCGRISGVVASASGGALAGVRVELARLAGWGWWQTVMAAVSDDSGAYLLTGLAPGTYRLHFDGRPAGHFPLFYPAADDWDAAADLVLAAVGSHLAGIDGVLEPSGAVAGRVTGAAGTGLAGVAVTVFEVPAGTWRGEFRTAGDGSYLAGGLAAGDYRLDFAGGTAGHGDAVVEPVGVESSVTTAGVDVSLELRPALAGRVTDAAGTGLPGIRVQVYRLGESWSAFMTETGVGGTWLLPVPPGEYQVLFSDWNNFYHQRWHADAAERDEATPVSVTGVTHTGGVGVVLDPVAGNFVWGWVLPESGSGGVPGIDLSLVSATDGSDYLGWAMSDDRGGYVFPPVPGGDYKIEVRPWASIYVGQWYDRRDDFNAADTVTLPADGNARADISLAEGGRFTGRVVGADSGEGLPGVWIEVLDPDDRWAWPRPGQGYSGPDGYFSIGGLPAGRFKVSFEEWERGYLSAYYDGKPDFESADLVTADLAAVTDLGVVALTPGASVSGTVTDAATGQPLPGTQVSMYRGGDGWAQYTVTADAAGSYIIRNVVPDDYRVRFSHGDYHDLYYDGRADLASATVVTVSEEGQQVTGIDGALVAAARLAGTVRDGQGAPLAGVSVGVYGMTSATQVRAVGTTDDAGFFSIAVKPVEAGQQYRVRFDLAGYLVRWFDGRADWNAADPVPAPGFAAGSSAVVTGLDAFLPAAGAISGQVRARHTGAPLSGVAVRLSAAAGQYPVLATAYTDAAGRYAFTQLDSGDYRLEFALDGYLTRWYGGAVSHDAAADVSVTRPDEAVLEDVQLVRAASIAGTVTRFSDGEPVRNASVELWQSDGGAARNWAWTNENGAYRFAGVDPDHGYQVRFRRDGYAEQWYDGRATRETADLLALDDGEIRGGVDAVLYERGAITGTVTDALTGAPVAGATVARFAVAGVQLASTTTNWQGVYTFPNLDLGDYQLRFTHAAYREQWHDSKPDQDGADPVSVTGTGAVVVNAALATRGAIAGVVSGEDTAGTGVSGVQAYLYSSAGAFLASASTDSQGFYIFNGLEAGVYRVRFLSGSSAYLGRWHANADSHAAADDVTVAFGQVAGLDIVLARGGRVAGTVSDSVGGGAVAGVQVRLFTAAGENVGTAATDTQGEYAFIALPSGDYRLSFAHAHYISQESAVFAVAAPETVTGDVALVMGGKIAGQVTDAASGDPLAGVSVRVFTAAGEAFKSTTSGADGAWEVPGVPAGEYRVRFTRDGYFEQWHEDKAAQPVADPVVVIPPQTAAGIDAALVRGGWLAGTVTRSDTGAPLAGVSVALHRVTGEQLGTRTTGAAGTWRFDPLAAGDYLVSFSREGFSRQWYDGRPDEDTADPLTVVLGEGTEGVAAALLPHGAIAGMVADADGGPLAGIRVIVHDALEQAVNAAFTGADGAYLVGNLPSGDYRVYFSPAQTGYLGAWYDGQAAFDYADPVTVNAPETTGGIDALLDLGGQVSGTVFGRLVPGEPPQPLENAVVRLQAAADPGGEHRGQAVSGADGTFVFTGLPAGDYLVRASRPGYLVRWYDGAAGALLPADAALVTVVPPQNITALEVTLPAPGGIAGRLTDSVSGAGVAGVAVRVYEENDSQVATVVSGADGAWQVGGLETGAYRLEFRAEAAGYFAAWYEGGDLGTARPVAVLPPAVTGGVDAALVKGGTIGGRVTGADGVGVAGVTVSAARTGGDPWSRSAVSDAAGNYLVGPLPAGDYLVRFQARNQGYLDQWYDGFPEQSGATPVPVVLNDTTGGIDASLVRPASLSGTVRDAAGEPIAGLSVQLRTTGGQLVTGTATGADGAYGLDFLRSGTYHLFFRGSALNYLDQWYDAADTVAAAVDITLATGEARTGLEATLSRPGGISGFVRDAAGEPIAGVNVQVRRRPGDSVIAAALSGADGAWLVSDTGMYAGEYFVRFAGNAAGYLDQWHPLVDESAAAAAVMVGPPQVTENIDAILRRPRVTARVAGAGGTALPADQEVPYNAPATVSITPDAGWSIDALLENGVPRQPSAFAHVITRVSADIEVTVAFREVPDLVVESVVMPAEVYTGGAIDVTWVLINQGRAPAVGPWNDRVLLLSDDGSVEQPLANIAFPGEIPPAGRVTRIQPVTVPATITGEGAYRLAVITDVNNNVNEGRAFEPGPNNNRTVSAGSINVRVSPRPDLVVPAVTAPATAFSGQTIEVAWTVENSGNGPTDAPAWFDRVYLSLDTSVDDSDIILGEVRNASHLSPGDSYRSQGTFTLPDGLEGDYFIVVRSDARHNVFEWDAANNDGHAVTRLSIPDLPDLVVTAISVPDFAASGQDVDIVWTVRNQGAASTPAATWFDFILLSEDDLPAVSAGDRHLDSFRRSGTLDPGESYTVHRRVSLPPDVGGPGWFIKAWTDSRNNVFEHVGAENNVTASDPFTIILQAADLELDAVNVPETALAGWPLEVAWTVVNRGTAPTSTSRWDDTVYLSASAELDTAAAHRLGSLPRHGRLEVGASYDGRASFRLPESIDGEYHVFVVVDSSGQVYEFDADNNTGRPAQPITVEFRPADLAATAVAVPAAADTGQALPVSWTVRNTGAGATAVAAWTDRVFITADPALEAHWVLLGEFGREGGLGPGEAYERTELVQVPFDIEGPHYVFVVADFHRAVHEPVDTRANNRSEGALLAVERVSADLAVTAVAAPADVDSGGKINVSWTVVNRGAGRTSSDNWHDRVILAALPADPGADIILGTVYRSGALEPGQEYSVSAEFALGPDVAGVYRLRVVTDLYRRVADPDRDNNELAATGATEVKLTPAPDLVLASIVAPAAAFSGEALEITWMVRNDDAATGPGDSWQDAFWLSRDQVLDSTDIFLGSAGHEGGLGAGESYTRTATFNVPLGLTGPFYVFGRADRWNRIHERGRNENNLTYRLQPVQLDLPAPADLRVSEVTVPAAAMPGGPIEVGFTVDNIGANPARGSWFDAVYLSPEPGWHPGATFLGQLYRSAVLGDGAAYTRQLEALVPGLVPGPYYGLVRADIFNNVLEGNLANNLGVSSSTVLLDAPALELDTPVSFELERGRSAWFRLDVDTAGQTLLVTLAGLAPGAANELYVSYGRMPTRAAHDFAFGRLYSPDQEVIVPLTRDGTYYVMAHASTIAGGCVLEARLIPFSLRRADPETAGDAGPVTLRFRGARFTRETAFVLLPPAGGAPLAATRTWFRDSGTAYATFDLAGAVHGLYRARATAPVGLEAEMEAAVRVQPGVGPRLEARVEGHPALTAGRDYVFYINYGNVGDGDGAPPLLIVRTDTGTPFGFRLDELDTRPRQILAGSPGGVAGIIRPGERYSFPMFFRSVTDPVRFAVTIHTVDDPTPIDWFTLEGVLRPEGLSDAAWAAAWARIRARVGDTWGGYVRLLGEIATLLGARGDESWNVADLLAELLAQEVAHPTARISGQLVDAESGRTLAATGMTVFSGELDEAGGGDILAAETVTAADGSFLFRGLAAGTYTLAVPGWFLPDAPRITVGPGVDVLGLVVRVRAEPDQPVLEPLAGDDRDPAFAFDAAGVPHLAWRRGADIWHAWHDGNSWVDAIPVTDTAGGDPPPAGAFSLAAGAGLIDGADAGLVLTWPAGEENESRLYRAVGAVREPGPGYRWSAPEAITVAPQADERPAAAVLADGRMVVVFQRVDLGDRDPDQGIRDDRDLYYAIYDVAGGTLDWRDPAAFGRLPGEMAPLDIGTNFDWKFRASTGAIPRRIPILGGRKAEFETHLWGSLSGGAEFGGAIGGTKKITLFGYIDGELSGAGHINFVNNCAHVDYPNCCYVFRAASFRLAGNVSAFIPVGTWVIPGDGWFVGKLLEIKVGPTINAGISGLMGWGSGSFPGMPSHGVVSMTAGLGGKGEAAVLDDAAKGSVSLTGNVSYELLPDRRPTGTELTFQVALESGIFAQSWSKTWSWEPREGFFGWSDDADPFAGVVPPVIRLPLADGGSVDYIEDQDGLLTVTTSPVTAGWRPWTGRGHSYAQPGIQPVLGDAVTGRVHEDGPPALALSAAGQLLLAWTQDVDPAGFGQDGSEVVTAVFDPDAGTWTAPDTLPGSIGYNDGVTVAFAGETPVVAWSRIDSRGLGPDTASAELLARLETGALAWSVRRAGTWSETAELFAVGRSFRPTLGTTPDGRVAAAWFNREHPDSENLRLLAAFWESAGGTWSDPVELAAGDLRDQPLIGRVGDRPVVFWVAAVGGEPESARPRLFSRSWNGEAGAWGATEAFAPESRPGLAAAPAPASRQAEGFREPLFVLPQPPLCCVSGPCERHGTKPPEPPEPPGSPEPPDPRRPGIVYEPPIRRAFDPNDMLGPEGYGPERWIRAADPIFYTIRFENDPEWATAPAQEVVITQQLDEGLDPRAFRVGSFGWGSLRFEVPAGRSFHYQRVDLREESGYLVDFYAFIDVTTGQARWQITTIDPATGQKPLDPFAGFLPPNDEEGIGEGFVTYTVTPRREVATGTVIDAEARIVFDTEAPIDTPPIFNTLDARPPESRVLPLPALVADPVFNVAWAGADDEGGAGLAHYTIHVSADGGPWEPWLAETTLTAAPFTGAPGVAYRFYSVATDNAGNSEAVSKQLQAEIVPEAATFVRDPQAVHTITASAGEGGVIDPAGPVAVNDGGAVTFTITPADRFLVAGVRVDGLPVGAVDEYTFSDVSRDHAIHAEFQPAVEKGDISGEGFISSRDVTLALRLAAGQPVTVDGTEYGPDYPDWLIDRADMDGDRRVTVSDALAILRLLLGR